MPLLGLPEALLSMPAGRHSVQSFLIENGRQYSQCVDALHSVEYLTNSDDYEYMVECRGVGGQLVRLWASGMNTTFFPDGYSFCVPPPCTVSALREFVVPSIIFEKMRLTPRMPLSLVVLRKVLLATGVDVDPVVDLTTDARYPTPDFVIAGAPLSGTTSLARALGQHPQIVIHDWEDRIFWSHNYIESQLDTWAKPYNTMAATKRASLPNASRLLFGIKEPMMIYSHAAMKSVAQIPGIKVIVLVRSAMDMIGSWIKHGVDWITPHGDPLSYLTGLIHRHLVKVVFSRIPEERILLVPTQALAKAPDSTYSHILKFLSLPATQQAAAAAGKQTLEQTHNKWVESSCLAFGRCFRMCDPLYLSFRTMLSRLVTADARLLDGQLAKQGWSSELRGLMPPLACPAEQTERSHLGAMEARPGMCQVFEMALPPQSTCFDSYKACDNCCEKFEGEECQPYSGKWAQCCEPLQMWYNHYATWEGRRVICGHNGSLYMPCYAGRGKLRFRSAP